MRQLYAIVSGSGDGPSRQVGLVRYQRGEDGELRRRPIVPPTPGEVRAIVAKAEERNPVIAALIMLAALTGPRRGELWALRWSDVDLTGGTLRIARSMLDVPDRPLAEGPRRVEGCLS